MSGLPPYSTFRTDVKQMYFPQATSHGNIMRFTPPGFKYPIYVKFPDSRLPVCEKCKRNFKTKEMCRVRNLHSGPPWSTAYICITIDDSCLDADGKFVEEPMTVRMVQWQPFCVKEEFRAKTPVCASCKRTNRTRNFCRERHRHRHLPWCTVYVLLSTLESVDTETVVAGPTTKEDAIQVGRKSPSTASVSSDSSSLAKIPKLEDPSENAADSSSNDFCLPIGNEEPQQKPKPEPRITGDDINDIAESRTFLATVSHEEIAIHWLEIVPLDSTQAHPDAPLPVPAPTQVTMPTGVPFDPAQMAVYPPNMTTTTAQQHQNALKSRQQYFFQLHQQQQFPTAAPVPVTQWPQQQQQQQPPPTTQQPYTQFPCYVQQQPQPMQGQHGDVPSGATAGEAAAARQQEGGEQAWSLYFASNFGGAPATDELQQQPEPSDSKRARLF